MLTAIAQSVEASTLKTSACLPIQIRIRRSTSGQTVRLRNVMASASHTSEVARRCWRAFPRNVISAPMLIVLAPLCEAEPIEEFQDVNGNLATVAESIAKARRAQLARRRRPRQLDCGPCHGSDNRADEEMMVLARRHLGVRTNSKPMLLYNLPIESSQCSVPDKGTKWRASEEPVEAEARAGVVQNEEPLHEDQEYI